MGELLYVKLQHSTGMFWALQQMCCCLLMCAPSGNRESSPSQVIGCCWHCGWHPPTCTSALHRSVLTRFKLHCVEMQSLPILAFLQVGISRYELWHLKQFVKEVYPRCISSWWWNSWFKTRGLFSTSAPDQKSEGGVMSGKGRLKCTVVLQSDLTLKYKAQ